MLKKFIIRLSILLITALVLTGGAVVAAYYLLPSAPTSNTTTADDDTLRSDDTYNILLCGVDEHHENADTIVIASFNAEKKTLKLLSVPRDTMSNEERGIQKINASYSVDHVGNIDQTIKEVEMVTAIPIDRYAITTFDGFEKAIDALGGVKMDVPQDLKYSDPYQNLEINIKKGEQTLDGKHALQFVRYRSGYVEGDIGRIKAQHLFFKALGKTLLDPSNITKMPALAKIISKDMETNLTVPEMLWFAKKAQGFNADSIKMFTLPGTPQYVNELSYYIPSQQGIIDLINKEFAPEGRQITARDLDLVPYASSAEDTTSLNDNEIPENIEGPATNYYDTNGSYPNSNQGGSTYYGSGGAYVPPAENYTGQNTRGYSTQTVPNPPTSDGNVQVVPSDGSDTGGGHSAGNGNTAPIQ